MDIYKIISQSPATYIDAGFPVTGYLIRVKLIPWNEIIELNSPTLNVKDVEPRINAIVDNRMALDKLGSIPDSEE